MLEYIHCGAVIFVYICNLFKVGTENAWIYWVILYEVCQKYAIKNVPKLNHRKLALEIC